MYEDVKVKLAQLENKLIDPELQKDQPSLIKLAQEHAALKKTVNLILAW